MLDGILNGVIKLDDGNVYEVVDLSGLIEDLEPNWERNKQVDELLKRRAKFKYWGELE